MYLVAMAWLYVALMMAVAEATHSAGTVLGAVFTFLLYGIMPVALVLYLMATPARRQRIKARELAEREAAAQQAASDLPDGSGHAPGATETQRIAPVREKA